MFPKQLDRLFFTLSTERDKAARRHVNKRHSERIGRRPRRPGGPIQLKSPDLTLRPEPRLQPLVGKRGRGRAKLLTHGHGLTASLGKKPTSLVDRILP